VPLPLRFLEKNKKVDRFSGSVRFSDFFHMFVVLVVGLWY
jgi:hypothetical protein